MESTTPYGPVANWIEKNGEEVMIVKFNVDNTREAIKELESEDLSLHSCAKGRNNQAIQGL